MTDAANSALTRWLGRLTPVEPRETRAVLTAFALFFCVLGGYFAVRPVRETMGTIIGEQRLAVLWTITAVLSVAIVPLYGLLAARLRRAVFLPLVYGGVAAAFLLFAWLLRADEPSIRAASTFYVLVSVINLFIVSVFWSFLVDLFDSGQSKRLFGFIAAGGTAGGLVGPLLTSVVVGQIGNPGVLVMGACAFLIAVVLQRSLLGIRGRGFGDGASGRREDKPLGGNPFAGFTLVLKSPYLLGLATFVVLLASVTTFLYFEQTRLVAETFADREQRTQVFAVIDAVVQTLAILTQVFFTGRLAQRLGVRPLLTFVPALIAVGFIALAFVGSFWLLAVVMIARRAGEYALIRPGREMLFTAVEPESKYKAKNVVDVPIYRAADAIAAWVKTGLGSAGIGPAGIALIGAGLAATWCINGLWLARQHERRSAPATQPPDALRR